MNCACRYYGLIRRYTTAPGFFGLGIYFSPNSLWPSVQLGKWVFTTEPCADEW